MFVYLKIGIWRGPDENKLILHTCTVCGVDTQRVNGHTNTSDVSIRYPFVKNRQISSLRISETLSLINMLTEIYPR